MGDIVPIRIKKGPDKGKVTQGATSWAKRWPDRFEIVKTRTSAPAARETNKTKKGDSE